jgi:hypothetical protein
MVRKWAETCSQLLCCVLTELLYSIVTLYTNGDVSNYDDSRFPPAVSTG